MGFRGSLCKRMCDVVMTLLMADFMIRVAPGVERNLLVHRVSYKYVTENKFPCWSPKPANGPDGFFRFDGLFASN